MEQLACLVVSMRNENIIMTLSESWPELYEYLITALKTMLTKEPTMDYVMACLMNKILKRKEREPQGEDATMVF